eukprot:CAMPEP_0114108442 /NCGR_PEP_ID=MMETSP0043_2-20121206/227_1 /TAXON_ID=464988 /ORGANISM="Hemiselmis andersenii, Strain CCMP644" /LENGTH=282 /DNA_ID=CAMNT_0001200217 /DNA_START=189 /DNA_END=1034 /DNA_ORIENTATION=-
MGGQKKKLVTVSHVLSHQSQLQMAGVDEMARDPYFVCDSGSMLRVLEESPLEGTPGKGDAKYHFLTFGWLVDGIVRGVTGGQSLAEYIAADIAAPLGIQEELMIGLGGAGGTEARKGRLATLVLSKSVQLLTKVADGQPKKDVEVEAPTTVPSASHSDSEEDVESDVEGGEGPRDDTKMRRPPAGPSLLLNPTFFNNPRIREASIPAANGHFTARALCSLYNRLASEASEAGPSAGGARLIEGTGWSEHVMEQGASGGATAKDLSIQGGGARFVGGFTVYHK